MYAKYVLTLSCFQVHLDERLHGRIVMIKIHPNGVKEMEEPLAEFSAKPGDSFIVFEKRGGLPGVAVEPKKWLRTWITSSGFNVNPHTELKKLAKKCAVCPYSP